MSLECVLGWAGLVYTIKIMRAPKGIPAISHVFALFIYCVASQATVSLRMLGRRGRNFVIRNI